MVRKIVYLLLVAFLSMNVFSNGLPPSGIDNGSVATDDFAFTIGDQSCAGVCITGTCVYTYIRCAGFVCEWRFGASLRIRHRIPELAVNVYQQTAESTWDDYSAPFFDHLKASASNNTFSLWGDSMETGGGETPSASKASAATTPVRFKEVEIFGNPKLALYELEKAAIEAAIRAAGGEDFGGSLCPTRAIPLVPYFLSEFDPEWRLNFWEQVLALNILPPDFIGIPYMVDEGRDGSIWPVSMPTTWGHTYPRVGWIQHAEDQKANAVVAGRAAHIVSRRGQPHFYNYIGDPPSSEGSYQIRYWGDSEYEPGSDRYVWQHIAPHNSSSCDSFGESDVLYHQNYSTQDKSTVLQTSAYSLWMEQECCQYRGVIIAAVEIDEICLPLPI